MEVFSHHLYEYKKGLRNLILHTTHSKYREFMEAKLKKNDIDYVITEVKGGRINVFFGAKVCVDVLRNFVHKELYEYTDEEDFILGTMLGYDRKLQCERYLERKAKAVECGDRKYA